MYKFFVYIFLILFLFCNFNKKDDAIISKCKNDFISNNETTSHNNSENDGSFILHHFIDNHSGPIILLSKKGLDVFMPNKFFDQDGNAVPYKGYTITQDNEIVSIDKDLKFIDLSITKNILWMFLSLLLLLLLFFICSRWYTKNPFKAPYGIVSIVEIMILLVMNDIVKQNIGPKKYKKFVPMFIFIFFFIWINNMLGLLPGAGNVTGNISVTAFLALLVFIIIISSGTKGFYKELLLPHVPRFLYPIIVPIEVLGLFIKPTILMIRLFANIASGHLVILSIISIVFVMQSMTVGFVVAFINALMLLLKILVSFLQAYIFVLLSSIYIGEAVKEETTQN